MGLTPSQGGKAWQSEAHACNQRYRANQEEWLPAKLSPFQANGSRGCHHHQLDAQAEVGGPASLRTKVTAYRVWNDG